MILFIDDEDARSQPWREALVDLCDRLGPVEYLSSADTAQAWFADPSRMAGVKLVVLDLAMYTPRSGLTDADTDLGRITGDALRRQLRKNNWRGPVAVLSHSRDESLRQRIETDRDLFARKQETPPSALVERLREWLPTPSGNAT